MDPVSIALLVGGGLASLGGGLFGQSQGNDERQKALDMMQQVYGNVPTVGQMQLGKSAFANIADNPQLVGDQTQSLGALQNVVDQGGLTLSDRAALQNIMGRIGQQTTARNAGAVDQAAQNGQAGSGAVLASQLANNASADQAANGAGTNIAAGAQARALQAMMAKGQLAGQIRGQDFGENAAKAQAADQIARYNAQLPMESWMAQSQAAQPLEGYYQQDANRQQQMWGGLGQGLGQMMMGLGGYGATHGWGGGGSAPSDSTPANLTNASYQSYYQNQPQSDPNEWSNYPG